MTLFQILTHGLSDETMRQHQHDGDQTIRNHLVTSAAKLGLAEKVTRDTLNQPLIKPSGGEEQRLVLLKTTLPILLHQTPRIQLLVIDEVTAGLDEENQRMVRSYLEELRVKMVVVDHHNHTYPDEVKLVVSGESQPPIDPPKPRVPNRNSWWDLFALHRWSDAKTSEKGEKPKKITPPPIVSYTVQMV